MVNYLLQRKRRGGSRHTRLVLLTGIAVVLFVASSFFGFGIPRAIRGLAVSAVAPLWKGESALAIHVQNFVGLVSSKRALVEENRRLLDEMSQHEAEGLLASLLRDENEQLRSLLGRDTRRSFVLGGVLSNSSASLYDTFIIDVGSADGIAIGNVAYAAGDVAVGTVSEVHSKTSLVQFFSAPGRETEVTIGEGGAKATAIGQGGGTFRAEVPRGLGVAEGDIISIPSFNLNIFGVVATVVDEETQPFQTVLFKNPVNEGSIRWVEVEVGTQP